MNWLHKFKYFFHLVYDCIGMPGYHSQSRNRQKPLPQMPVYLVLYRSLRRLCQIRLQCFQRIWYDADKAQRKFNLGIRILQTFILLEVSLDLFVIYIACLLYYLLSFNRISKWCSFFIIPLLCGLYLRGNYLPLFLYLFIDCYVLSIWLTCSVFPAYLQWVHYNLTYVSLTKLTGDLPGKHAMRFYIGTLFYLLWTSVEDFIRNMRILKSDILELAETPVEMIDLVKLLVDTTPTYHHLLEQFLIDCVTNVIHLIQVILTAFF